jgi:hypothetical protein
MGDTLTTLQDALRRNYSPKLAKSTLLNNNMFRLFQDVSKSLKMGGQDWALYEPIRFRHSYGTAGGTEGGDFGSDDSEGIDQWQLGVARIHSVASLTGDLVDNIRKAPSLSYFEDPIALKMDSIKDAAAVVLGYQIFGKGDGALCQVDTTQGGIDTGDDFFYVDNPGPEWLQVGMLIQAYDNNTTGGTKQLTANTSAFQRILQLERTVDGTTKVYIEDVTGLSNDDYIYQRGHYGITPMTGLLGMVDDGTNMPTFQSIDRTDPANSWALAHVFDADGAPLSESVVFPVFEELVRRSPTKKITHIVTDPTSFSWLALSLLDRQRFQGTRLVGGFQEIDYESPFGKIKITSDPLCPSGYIFFLDANELGLGWGTKAGGQWFDEDGEPLKPMPSSSSGIGYSDKWVMAWRMILQTMLSVPQSCAVLTNYDAP